MKDILKRDSTLRIFAVLFALFFWYFVVDSLNPEIPVELSVPVKVINNKILSDKGLVAYNGNIPKNVTVSLKGRKQRIETVNSNDIEAVLDLSKVKNNEGFIDVYINKLGVQLEGISPKTLSIDIEKIGENPFRVEIVQLGNPKAGYKIYKMLSTPEIIAVQGSKTLINNIGAVKAFVEVNDINKDVIKKKECKVYDKSGREITDITFNPFVDINIEVVKEVPIIAYVKGRPDSNFVDGTRKVYPQTALIKGDTAILDRINEIRTGVVDIESSNSIVNKIVPLILSDGIELVDTPQNVRVSVDVLKIATKDIVLDVENINFINKNNIKNYKYNLLTKNLIIKLAGNKEEIDALDNDKIKPYIDVEGLNEGLHQRKINFILPSTVYLLKDCIVEVKVSN